MTANCQRCTKPTDGALCNRCTGKLTTVLTELRAFLTELEVAVARQDHVEAITSRRYGLHDDPAVDEYRLIEARLRSPHGRYTLPSTPWAYGADAAVLLREARRDVRQWTILLRAAGVTDPQPAALDTDDQLEGPAHRAFIRVNETSNPVDKPAPTTCRHPSCMAIIHQRAAPTRRDAIGWLQAHRVDLARYHRAGDLLSNLIWHRNRVEASVDRREPEVFLGVCDAAAVVCGAELYAHPDDRDIECKQCGWLYNVPRRKARLLTLVYDQLRPVRQTADAVSGLLTDDRDELVECTESMVRNYIDRGRLTTVGVDPSGRQLVRVGDVVELVRAKMERDKARRARRPRKVPA